MHISLFKALRSPAVDYMILGINVDTEHYTLVLTC